MRGALATFSRRVPPRGAIHRRWNALRRSSTVLFRHVVNIVQRRRAEGKQRLPVAVCDRKVTRSDDVHSDEHICAGRQLALGNAHARHRHVVRETDVDEEDFGVSVAVDSRDSGDADRMQIARLNHPVGDDAPGRAGIPDCRERCPRRNRCHGAWRVPLADVNRGPKDVGDCRVLNRKSTRMRHSLLRDSEAGMIGLRVLGGAGGDFLHQKTS